MLIQSRVFRSAMCLGAALCLFPLQAWSATKTWTGGGADANWSTAGNWSPAGAPINGDDLVFDNSGARRSNNNDLSSMSFNTITITNPSPGYTLNGNSIQLANGITATNVAASMIDLPILLSGNQTFAINGDRLQIYALINLNAHLLTVTTSSPSGVLELRGGIAGSGGLVANGGGFLYVSDNPGTFTGTTAVQGGIMGIVGVALGSSVVTVTSGTLQLVNGGQVGDTTVNGGTLYLGGGGISQHGSTAALTMNFPATLQLDMNSASDFGQLIVAGPLQLNNPFLYTHWSFNSSAGNSFLILNPMTSAGSFNGQPEGSHFIGDNGRRYAITYVAGVSGHQIVLADDPAAPPAASAIPALSPFGLLALSALVAIAFVFLRKHLRAAAR